MYKAKYIGKSSGCLCIGREMSPPPYKKIIETKKLLESPSSDTHYGHFINCDESDIPKKNAKENITIETGFYQRLIVIYKAIKEKLSFILPSSCFQ